MMKAISLFLYAVMFTACTTPPQPVALQPQGPIVPGLTIPGPYAESPVVAAPADSGQRPSGGIYLRSSDHGDQMNRNIIEQTHIH